MNLNMHRALGLIVLIISFAFILFNCKGPFSKNALKQKAADHKHEYNDHFFSLRNYPENTPDVNAYFKQLNLIKAAGIKKSSKKMIDWRLEGPKNLGGRFNSIAIDPANANIMYAAAARGGIFKTINGGNSWEPIFDKQILLSVSKIVIDPNNSSIIYAGTGDANISGYPSIGDGLYRSTNSGLTWQNIGLEKTRIISDIFINPENSNEIYVSTMGLPYERNVDRGLYKTIDGGATWDQILFVSPEVGIIDLAANPSNPQIIYAAGWNRIRNNTESTTGGPGAKIFKTYDGGKSWKALKDGLPQEDFSRIAIEISKKNPEKLYVTYIDTMHSYHSTFKTVDGGDSWSEFEYNSEQLATYGGPGQDFGWYFGKIRIDPVDDDIVYILGVNLLRVRNEGKNWKRIVEYEDVHPDFHDMQFVDDNTAIVATDGGIYKGKKDSFNNWRWEDIDDIPNSQFYKVAVNPHKNGVYGGGLQDNGTSQGNYQDSKNWTRLFGGDGFTTVYHPTYNDKLFATTQNGSLYLLSNYESGYTTGNMSIKSFNKGIDSEDRTNWNTPYLISKHNSKVLYKGTYRMYKTENDTIPDWKPISEDLTDGLILHKRFHTITTIDESPINPLVLLAGTVDANVWITKDGGTTWEDIKYGLPRRYITSVKASPTDDKTIYVTQSGYKDNDNRPYIYKSTNSGQCWMSISSNLPAVALNEIEIFDNGNGTDEILFAATDGGVFYSNNGGFEWHFMSGSMPLVSVYDMEIDYKNNRIVAGTFARSMYSYALNDILDTAIPITSLFDTIPPVLSISSPLEVNVVLGQSYDIPHASASDNIDCDINIEISSNVNTGKEGIYFVTYDVTDAAGNKAQQAIRVIVTEDLPPVLNITSNDSISFFEGNIYLIPTAMAIDDVDGDLTAQIKESYDININVPGNYSIIFSVTDSNNNTATDTVFVEVKKDLPPVITIEGDAEISINQNTELVLPNITATDDADGDLTDKIEITNDNINTTVVGSYTVIVSVMDSFGNRTEENIEVNVVMATGVEEEWLGNAISIWPNPVTEMLNVTFDKQKTQITQLSLFNLSGQLLITQVVGNKDEAILNLGDLPKGNYLLKIKTSDNTYVQRSIIKK